MSLMLGAGLCVFARWLVCSCVLPCFPCEFIIKIPCCRRRSEQGGVWSFFDVEVCAASMCVSAFLSVLSGCRVFVKVPACVCRRVQCQHHAFIQTKTKGRARAAYNAGFQACENQEEQEVALFCLASASVYLIHTWHVRVAFVLSQV